MESPEAGSSIPSPTIQSQLDGKSPTSSSSSPETPDSTRLEAEGGGDDEQSALDLLRSPQERPRRQRSSPTAIIESPPNEASTKPKKKTGGSKKGTGGAKAALQERKRRRVLTEWAPENVFDIIQHTSYPTRTTLGGEHGQIREGDDAVCPPALEPVTPAELKRMRLESEADDHAREQAADSSPFQSTSPSADDAEGAVSSTSMAVEAAEEKEQSLQKMSIATLVSGSTSSSAPAAGPAGGATTANTLSINDIINAPGNDDNILDAEDFFSLALSTDTAVAEAALGSLESQPEDEEVRQEWDKLASLLQEEQNKEERETKHSPTQADRENPGEVVAPKDEPLQAKKEVADAPQDHATTESPQTESLTTPPDAPAAAAAAEDQLSPQESSVAMEDLPYGYLDAIDEKEPSEEDSEDEYVETNASSGKSGGGSRKGKKGGGAKGKGKGAGGRGKAAAGRGQRKGGRASGGGGAKAKGGSRKSSRSQQSDELMLADDTSADGSTPFFASPLLSPIGPSPSSSSSSAAAAALLMQAKMQKMGEMHRRDCKNGRETGCEFCSILDCKLGNEDHYRKENEGGCPCRDEPDMTTLPVSSPYEVGSRGGGRTRSGRKSAESMFAAADTSLEEEIVALDVGKGGKRKRFEVEEFNRPEELPLATLKLDSTKAVIDKTLIKEGKSVTSGYYKENYGWADRTFINCDLRYYNLASLGKFDAILIDPPWRIKGNQLISNEKTMFNNSKWGLSYGTLSNDEIIDIDVGCLSDKGFIFLWVINSQIEFGFKCLQKWGYTYVDRITWVKKTASGNIAISQGYYFLHSSEICLVGVKYDAKGKSLEFISKTSNDLLFAEIREKSRKPDQLYHIIERMVPGGRKVEIFARNHNMRPGWLSLGNQLGEYYDWDHDLIRCDMCTGAIPTGKTRYKSRTVADSDLCAACYQKSGGSAEQYFEIENVMAEMAFHQYFACDGCETKPLWGLRFHCTECDDCDLCELCYDKKLLPEHLKETHRTEHKFDVIEMPDLAGGLPVHHEYRCMGCQTKPIIGYRFVCLACNGLSLCQKCFFLRKEPRNHKATHNMDIIVDSNIYDQFKCAICALFPIKPVVYKCVSCFNYDLCERCHDECAPPPATNTSHKPSHKFKKITVTTDDAEE